MLYIFYYMTCEKTNTNTLLVNLSVFWQPYSVCGTQTQVYLLLQKIWIFNIRLLKVKSFMKMAGHTLLIHE